MRASERYTKGLGDAALGLRCSRSGQFWDFVALAAVGAESADTLALLTEYPNAGDAKESMYEVDIPRPNDGNVWDTEIIVIATGQTIASGDTQGTPLETDDPRLDNLDSPISALSGAVAALPTNTDMVDLFNAGQPETPRDFTKGRTITAPQGDQYDHPFNFGVRHDCTGRRLYFTWKANIADDAALGDVLCTLTDEENVVGHVPLTPTLLATEGRYIYEYQSVDANGLNPHTIEQGVFIIAPVVRI